MAERAETDRSILRAARDEVHSEMSELVQALSAVVGLSNALWHSLATARRMATTMPGGISYIGRDGTVVEGVRIRNSDLDGEWGAEWQRLYGQWCRSIRDAIDAVGRPSVAAIMDPNSHPHPALCWTALVRDSLNRLHTSLHPRKEGADGMGFLRAGVNSLPASFTFPLDRIRGAVAELRAVAPTFTPVAKAVLSARDDDDAPASRLPKLKAHDRQAWQLATLYGMTQDKVAAELNREHGTTYTQGQVSRMIARAKDHADANGLTEKVAGPIDRPRTVDPGRLELGARVDKRKPRPSDMARANDDDE